MNPAGTERHPSTASIIITCYNLGAYLAEALESALSQTYPETEVLLVDDGSTDPATIAALDSIAPHPRLRVLRTPNQGVAHARNYGIRQALGDYILPLDADDRILPTYLEQAVAILDKNPEIGFVGSHYRIFGAREGEARPTAYQIPDMLVENVVPIASVYRRACWEDVGGYCADVAFEDWDLWLSFLGRGFRGHVIPEILFEYRVRPGSRQATNQEPDSYIETLQSIYRRHHALYERYRADVLALKDRQFAYLLAHSTWLASQVRNWEIEAAVQKRDAEQLRQALGRIGWAVSWYSRQIARWRQITTDHPTRIAQIRAVSGKLLRYLQRSIARS
jgi:glycosyltransferase involved in cell wall biosynthesis